MGLGGAVWSGTAAAQDATWLLDPTVAGPVGGTFDFNADANWENLAAAPTGQPYSALRTGRASRSRPTRLSSGWTLNVDASNYDFTIGFGQSLIFDGAGIVINGGSATITNDSGGFLEFFGSSTAGSAIITNENALAFFDTSTADSATITNNHILQFVNNSTGWQAQNITNAPGSTDFPGSRGHWATMRSRRDRSPATAAIFWERTS
jgi:hypothetical protein